MPDLPPAAAERPARALTVRGARTHNLKVVDLSLTHRQLIVLTGVSGSGKSSLAFDTIYAEGQRRYVESLSAYARQFLERMEKPAVESIDGIAPAIAIRQKNRDRNPRSTVGTTTEIHDYLRLLWARVGRTICRQCGREVERESPEVVARQLMERPAGTRLLVGFDYPIVTVAGSMPSIDNGNGAAESGIAETIEAAAEAEAVEEALFDTAPEAPKPEDPIRQALQVLRKRGFGRVLVDG